MTKPHHFLLNLTTTAPATEAGYFSSLGFAEVYPPLVEDTHLFADNYLHIQLSSPDQLRQGLCFITEQPLDSLAAELQQTGLQTVLKDNKIRLVAPNGTAVYWLSQQDHEFPATDRQQASLCGAFYEISLEVDDLEANRFFWKTLGFEKIHPEGDRSTWLTMSNQVVRIGLYQRGSCPHPFHSPAITFFNTNAAEVLEQVQQKGFRPAHVLPAEGPQPEEAILETPSSHHLFLFKAW